VRYTEAGLVRALRVYASIAERIGVDGPKHDKPIEQDRVYQYVKRLENRHSECRCHELRPRNEFLEAVNSEKTKTLVQVGDMLRDAGFGGDYIVDVVARCIAAAKGEP
jgi:hypothetical protein